MPGTWGRGRRACSCRRNGDVHDWGRGTWEEGGVRGRGGGVVGGGGGRRVRGGEGEERSKGRGRGRGGEE